LLLVFLAVLAGTVAGYSAHRLRLTTWALLAARAAERGES
jgi:hypothetical protein